jgi:hypothetical protein
MGEGAVSSQSKLTIQPLLVRPAWRETLSRRPIKRLTEREFLTRTGPTRALYDGFNDKHSSLSCGDHHACASGQIGPLRRPRCSINRQTSSPRHNRLLDDRNPPDQDATRIIQPLRVS